MLALEVMFPPCSTKPFLYFLYHKSDLKTIIQFVAGLIVIIY